MSRWLVTFETLDPRNPGADAWQVGIHESHLRRLRNSNHEAPLARIVLVEQVVSNPDMIISGWDRPDRGNCFVYVGRPKDDYRKLRIAVTAPPDMVFLVFVLPDGTIDYWAWRPSQPNSSKPEGLTGEIAWQRT